MIPLIHKKAAPTEEYFNERESLSSTKQYLKTVDDYKAYWSKAQYNNTSFSGIADRRVIPNVLAKRQGKIGTR